MEVDVRAYSLITYQISFLTISNKLLLEHAAYSKNRAVKHEHVNIGKVLVLTITLLACLCRSSQSSRPRGVFIGRVVENPLPSPPQTQGWRRVAL